MAFSGCSERPFAVRHDGEMSRATAHPAGGAQLSDGFRPLAGPIGDESDGFADDADPAAAGAGRPGVPPRRFRVRHRPAHRPRRGARQPSRHLPCSARGGPGAPRRPALRRSPTRAGPARSRRCLPRGAGIRARVHASHRPAVAVLAPVAAAVAAAAVAVSAVAGRRARTAVAVCGPTLWSIRSAGPGVDLLSPGGRRTTVGTLSARRGQPVSASGGVTETLAQVPAEGRRPCGRSAVVRSGATRRGAAGPVAGRSRPGGRCGRRPGAVCGRRDGLVPSRAIPVGGAVAVAAGSVVVRRPVAVTRGRSSYDGRSPPVLGRSLYAGRSPPDRGRSPYRVGRNPVEAGRRRTGGHRSRRGRRCTTTFHRHGAGGRCRTDGHRRDGADRCSVGRSASRRGRSP